MLVCGDLGAAGTSLALCKEQIRFLADESRQLFFKSFISENADAVELTSCSCQTSKTLEQIAGREPEFSVTHQSPRTKLICSRTLPWVFFFLRRWYGKEIWQFGLHSLLEQLVDEFPSVILDRPIYLGLIHGQVCRNKPESNWADCWKRFLSFGIKKY